jgi:hypothetical protein
MSALHSRRSEIEQPAFKDDLASYPRQALAQNRVQFWATLIAASLTLGLGIYLIAIAVYGYIALRQSLQVASIEAFLSMILDLASVLYFRQLNETRKYNVEMYDRMRFDERVAGAITLTESIDDPIIRSETKAKLVLLLIKPQYLSVKHSKDRL